MTNRHFFLRGLLLAIVSFFAINTASFGQGTPDPGLPGPLAVTKDEYNLGDLAFTTPSFPNPIEVRGSVHYPTGLAGGPYPVILFLHGRHETCYETSDPTNVNSAWPCPSGWQSIVSYEGYDYLARQMASYGYIVISISCNAINATDAPSNTYGMPGRAAIMQHHLDLWNTWNTTASGPFGSTFIGKLNLQNVGTMGHSRGGEGVVYHALLNRSLGSPYGIKAVFTLAPVDFKRKVLNGIPLMNLAPYCDGDVSDQQGVHFYDNPRYADTTDETPKHNILFMGANHNFFNTVWTPGSYIAGGGDDWDDYQNSTEGYCGTDASTNKRFDTATQKAALKTYLSAFFRTYIGHEKQFLPILTVRDIVPPTSSTLDTTNVFLSYHPGRTDRFDINRTDSVITTTTNTLGGSVVTGGLLTPGICGGGYTETACGVATAQAQEPHRGVTGGSPKSGLSQMKLRWNDPTDYYENDIPPAYQDLTYVQNLQFRVAINFAQTTPGSTLNFTVALIDSAGDTSNVVVGNHTHTLSYPPGSESGILPKVLFNTVSLDIREFTGIDSTKARKVLFRFNKSATGSILVSDLAFVNMTCGKLNTSYSRVLGSGGHIVTFTDSTTVNYGDTVKRLWYFGDPTSGTNDTSSLTNPTHYYPYGTHTACLYVTAVRRNGNVCTDTFCTTVSNPPPAIVDQNFQEEIAIVPNPARDRIQVFGAEQTDVLKLFDVMGREVLSTEIGSCVINLSPTLANGVYYALVVTKKGTIYKKMVISR
jgi:hypothetical protein